MNKTRNNYANIASVTGTREEIDIRFGKSIEDPDSGNITGVLGTNWITMSPFVAKRLALVLDSQMKEYEVKYGPFGDSLDDNSEKIELGIDLLPSEFRTQNTTEEAGLLLELIRNLNLEVGFERSIKLFPEVILVNRFLAGFKRYIGETDLDKRIMDICKYIHMPPDFISSFQEGLSEANIVLFGFEEHEDNCIYKSYLEFGHRFGKIFQKTDFLPKPFTLHLGYKWDTKDNNRNAIAEYKCFPSIPVKAILDRLTGSFYGKEKKDLFDITSGLIDAALKIIEPYEILYLEVEEKNNPRRSFDINIYRANLTLETLYPWLLRMFKYFSISPEVFHDLYNPVKDQIFGHLSGGIDREGRDFLTFYFGVKGSSRSLDGNGYRYELP